MGRAWPFTNKASLVRGLQCRISSLLVKRYERMFVEIRRKKMGSSCPAFQGHSKSSEVTRFLFHSNHGTSRTTLHRFLNIVRYWPKLANFSYPIPIYRFAEGQRDHNRYSLNTWSKNANYRVNLSYFHSVPDTAFWCRTADAESQRFREGVRDVRSPELVSVSSQLSAVSVLVSSSISIVSVSVSVSCV